MSNSGAITPGPRKKHRDSERSHKRTQSSRKHHKEKGKDSGKERRRRGDSPSARKRDKSSPSIPDDVARLVGVKYKILEVLGRGAFGTVHKAMDVKGGGLVAVKLLDIEQMPKGMEKDLTMREIDMIRKLDHPNIVRVVDHMRTPTHLCFVFEFVEGGSLFKIINKFGTFPESLVAIYAEQLLSGLQYLHANEIVHGDIKAANMLIDKTGVVQLADFGLAKKSGESSVAGGADSPVEGGYDNVEPLGSPFWMPPEIILMEPATFASDIWSVGCTVIELFTGDPPYFDLPAMTAMFRIVEEGAPPLPDELSTRARDFLEMCFEEDPKQRATASELLSHAWISELGGDKKLKLEKTLSQKNISSSIQVLKPQKRESEEMAISRIVNIAQGDGSDEEVHKSIQTLHQKHRDLSKRIANLQKNQPTVKKMERLYGKGKMKAREKEERQERIKKFQGLQATIEEHLDQIRNFTYMRARAIGDNGLSPKDKGNLRFMKGDTVFIHSMNPHDEDEGLWLGEVGYHGVVGTFSSDKVKVLAADAVGKKKKKFGFLKTKDYSMPNLGSMQRDDLIRGSATIIEEATTTMTAESDRGRLRDAENELSACKAKLEECQSEIAALRSMVSQLELMAEKQDIVIHELSEDNLLLREELKRIKRSNRASSNTPKGSAGKTSSLRHLGSTPTPVQAERSKTPTGARKKDPFGLV